MDVVARLAAIRERLADTGEEALLITGVSNLVYLTGFEGVIDLGINAAAVITAEATRFYTDHRYGEAALAAADGTPWSVHVQQVDLYTEACAALKRDEIGSLVLEASIPYGRFKFISEVFEGAVRAVDHFVETVRQVKEPAEIERIAEAAALGDRAFDYIVGCAAPGMTELEVAIDLEFFLRRAGSEGVPFPPIVATGPNAARPHAIPGDRRIASGDFLKLDFGARIDGYCSDMTRTIVVGSATERHREIYSAVLAANEAGLAAVRAGVPATTVDAAARELLTQRGFGELFTHGVGHGVGLDVHELPTLGKASTDSLRGGAVVTVEPGVYVPGFGGVRIEDLVVVQDGGCRVLTRAPKDLIEV
jgi:Xaa-Pro aminopeptidase